MTSPAPLHAVLTQPFHVRKSVAFTQTLTSPAPVYMLFWHSHSMSESLWHSHKLWHPRPFTCCYDTAISCQKVCGIHINAAWIWTDEEANNKQLTPPATVIDYYCSLLYNAVLRSHSHSLRSCRMRISMSDCILLQRVFLISTEMVYFTAYLVVAWPVPRETAAVSARVLCTPFNHAPIYSVTSFKAT